MASILRYKWSMVEFLFHKLVRQGSPPPPPTRTPAEPTTCTIPAPSGPTTFLVVGIIVIVILALAAAVTCIFRRCADITPHPPPPPMFPPGEWINSGGQRGFAPSIWTFASLKLRGGRGSAIPWKEFFIRTVNGLAVKHTLFRCLVKPVIVSIDYAILYAIAWTLDTRDHHVINALNMILSITHFVFRRAEYLQMVAWALVRYGMDWITFFVCHTTANVLWLGPTLYPFFASAFHTISALAASTALIAALSFVPASVLVLAFIELFVHVHLQLFLGGKRMFVHHLDSLYVHLQQVQRGAFCH